MPRLSIWFCFFLLGTLTLHAQDVQGQTRPLFLAHFMPWYQTPDVSGYWGWHWTMDTYNPNTAIASHYMPLTGPYDSQDEAILEYQVLLMHLSGIDGVIVDWYGTENYWDYAINNQATLAIGEAVREANLAFALAYEDATVRLMVEGGHIAEENALAHGQAEMAYANEQWMSHENYVTWDDRPLMFIFGPQYFTSPVMWETIFDQIEPEPLLITLDKHMEAIASYPWPPMNLSENGELAQGTLETYLDYFYFKAQLHNPDLIVGSAFPGFHDIYEQAGVRSSYGFLDARDGKTLQLTLEIALENEADVIQLLTWNDYGEGTMIEPTVEYGYQYLEMVQAARRSVDADFPYTADDLRLPLQLFELRKANRRDAAVNQTLDAVFEAIIVSDLTTARGLLDG